MTLLPKPETQISGTYTRSITITTTYWAKWFKLSFAADDPITQEDACPEDSNCPSECYCEGGTVDCSHRELKGMYCRPRVIVQNL